MLIRKEIRNIVRFVSNNLDKFELQGRDYGFKCNLEGKQDTHLCFDYEHHKFFKRVRLSLSEPNSPTQQKNNPYLGRFSSTDIKITYIESVWLYIKAVKLYDKVSEIETQKILKEKLKFISDMDFKDKVNKILDD